MNRIEAIHGRLWPCRPALAIIAVLALALAAGPVAAKSGRFALLLGSVTVNGKPASRGVLVNSGDRIATGRNGRAKLIMRDRSVVDISPNSRFEVTDFAFDAAKPDESRSSFSLLRGAFRYVSGLIAKARPDRVVVASGGATLGVRGSFVGFENPTGGALTVTPYIGSAVATFSDGSELTIGTGLQGVLAGQASLSTLGTPSSVDGVSAAARALAANPADSTALAGLSEANKILVLAVLINNRAQLASELGTTIDGAALAAAAGTVTANVDPASSPAQRTAYAQLTAFLTTALDPDNQEAYITAISSAPDVNGNAVREAAEIGATEDAPAPDSAATTTTAAIVQSVTTPPPASP